MAKEYATHTRVILAAPRNVAKTNKTAKRKAGQKRNMLSDVIPRCVQKYDGVQRVSVGCATSPATDAGE